MKSNEDYLDELLKSMSQETTEESSLARFGLQNEIEEEPAASDAGMGKMDQAMIDALLAGAAGVEEEPEEPEVPMSDAGMGKMDQAMIDALLAGVADEDINGGTEIEEIAVEGIENLDSLEDLEAEFGEQLLAYEEPEYDVMSEILEDTEVPKGAESTETSSMLAQLMAEMQEEAKLSESDSIDDVQLMDEDSIDALLSAAKDSNGNMYEEQPISFEMSDDGDMAEIEALLSMSESDEALEENSALLRMLEEAEATTPDLGELEEALEVDEAELEAILSAGNSSGNVKKEETSEGKKQKKKEKKEKVKKEKKPFNLKEFLAKIASALLEEVPDDESGEETGINLSEENKAILNELDQEADKKIKGKDKKKEKAKKEKKEKPKKEKKPKKQKPSKDLEPGVPERKIPRKKIIVTFIFGFSVLALILLIETLVPPMLTQSRARSAYDKGDYYEAYKEYYGQTLSEEDEKRFQGATTILRMQSNLDGYNNYLKMNKEVKALHSLLDAVKVKFDVFLKAEEYNVLSQVSEIYEQILEILNSKYHLSEEEALELVNEESDAVYTRKLEALVEGKSYTNDSSSQMNQNDMLPEEEEIFQN